MVETDYLGEMQLKGFARPVAAFNILDLKEGKTGQAAF
jgi:hypothetical protein